MSAEACFNNVVRTVFNYCIMLELMQRCWLFVACCLLFAAGYLLLPGYLFVALLRSKNCSH